MFWCIFLIKRVPFMCQHMKANRDLKLYKNRHSFKKVENFILDQNYANANTFFSDWKIYPGYAIGKLTSMAFWKCGGFCCEFFLNPSYGWLKLCQIWKQKTCGDALSKNNATAKILRFKLPYWISVCQIGIFWGWFNGRT